MEAHAAFAGGHPQLRFHHFTAGVLRDLQVVDAGHHRRQILVRVLIAVDLLAHDCQRWRQGFESARRQARRARYELKEQPLVLARVLTQNVVEILNGERILREAVVGSTAVGQHANVPLLVVRRP